MTNKTQAIKFLNDELEKKEKRPHEIMKDLNSFIRQAVEENSENHEHSLRIENNYYQDALFEIILNLYYG